MGEIFLKILNMSIIAGWLALAVMLLRFPLKKAPKYITVLLWASVGIRLVCPFSFESVMSLIPSANTVSAEILFSDTPSIQSGIPVLNSAVNPIISEALAPQTDASVNPAQIMTLAAGIVWLCGVAAMLIYSAVSYIKLLRKVRESVPFRDNVMLCDRIPSPFILGIFRPKIYLPSDVEKSDIPYILAHENAHLKRLDCLWKPLAFLLLSVYWFNPILWAAYILFCKDIELSCDEKVIESLGEKIKKPYSEALLNCSVQNRPVSACPLAFGETGVKTRIKSVLNYKKPAFWAIAAALILCAAVAVCFLTDPKSGENNPEGFGIIISDSGSTHGKVTFRCISVKSDGKAPFIKGEWINETDETVYFGNEFKLYKENEPCEIKDGYGWHLILNTIPPGGRYTDEFFLDCFDISEKGNYRIEKEFGTENDPDRKYSAYINFTVREPFSPDTTADFKRASVYKYNLSPDPLAPTVVLFEGGNDFSFTYSVFSSYIAVGKYELTKETLSLKTADGKNVYVFDLKEDGSLVFNAANSSEIPEYRYSGDSFKTDCPVPDGAVFIYDGKYSVGSSDGN